MWGTSLLILECGFEGWPQFPLCSWDTAVSAVLCHPQSWWGAILLKHSVTLMSTSNAASFLVLDFHPAPWLIQVTGHPLPLRTEPSSGGGD